MARALRFASATLLCVPLSVVGAQGRLAGAAVTFANRSASAISTAPANTISLAISAVSASGDSLVVVPVLSTPKGWDITIGSQPFALAPRESDTWIVGVSIPAGAGAGRYVIRISARIASATVAVDSVVVAVKERRAISLAVVDRPVYAVSGDAYEIGYRIHNAGNVSETIRLMAAASNRGSAKIDAPIVALAAGETKSVRVTVTTLKGYNNNDDDVFELRASTDGDSSLSETASAKVVLVRKPGTSAPMTTVPAVLRVRAARNGSGVSPYELVGGGRISTDRPEEVDFLFRGKTAKNSILGERAENRVEIRAPRYTARIGDNYYALSPLTGGGQTGFGGGLELTGSAVTGGAYYQKFRYAPRGQNEHGGYLRFEPSGRLAGSRLALNAVERIGGSMAGRIFSSAVTLRPVGGMLFDVEVAASQNDSGSAVGRMVRLSGSAVKRVHYDLGQMAGGALFLGPSRNAENEYADVSFSATDKVTLHSAMNLGNLRMGVDSTLSTQRFLTATLGAMYAGGLSLEYSQVGRESRGGPTPESRAQQLVRGRFERGTGFGNVWIASEIGKRSDSSSTWHQLGFGASVTGGRAGLSFFVDTYDGGSLTRGPNGNSLLGANGSVMLSRTNSLSFGGFASRYHAPGSRTYAQADTRLTHSLANGSSVTARYRFSASPSAGVPPTKLFYLEYGLPLRLPMGHAHVPGKVSGRVIDAESKRAVAGALVRVGSQAAVTDKNGRVSFVNLRPGDYRVSLTGETSLANAAVTGNPLVHIDSLRHDAPNFSLAVSKSATVKGIVRQFAVARTAIADAADSLVDSGPLEGITVALVGSRDTLYRTTAADGKFLFGEVPGGNWTMFVTDDAPAAFRYERQRVQVTTSPGKEADVEFRLVPRHKSVRVVASGDAPSLTAPSSNQEPRHK